MNLFIYSILAYITADTSIINFICLNKTVPII